jgi:hypothetical protein
LAISSDSNTAPLIIVQFGLERLLGVRRLDAALLSMNLDRGQSGVKPPHSRETPSATAAPLAEIFPVDKQNLTE